MPGAHADTFSISASAYEAERKHTFLSLNGAIVVPGLKRIRQYFYYVDIIEYIAGIVFGLK
jgi:hypothetical protein